MATRFPGTDDSDYTASHAGTGDSSPLSAVALAVLAVIRRTIGAALIGAAMFTALSFALAKQYTAQASFIPDANQGLSGALGGLVGQFSGLQSGVLSPRLAGDLVQSRPSIVATLYTRFPTRPPGTSRRLLEVLTESGLMDRMFGGERDSSLREASAIRELRSRLAVDVNERTGIVQVVVRMEDPVLAASVANFLVDQVDVFNETSSQSRAGATRRFLDKRASDAAVALRDAESSLEAFYTVNRGFQGSPRLVFEEGRLKREVELRQQVFLSLNQQLEQARIDEVKDTPVLTRIETATPPAKKSSPRRGLFLVFGLLLGALWVAAPAAARGYLGWYSDAFPLAHERLQESLRPLSSPSLKRIIGKLNVRARRA